jgi:hypothetical protein
MLSGFSIIIFFDKCVPFSAKHFPHILPLKCATKTQKNLGLFERLMHTQIGQGNPEIMIIKKTFLNVKVNSKFNETRCSNLGGNRSSKSL